MSRKYYQNGFTLVEIAVVLVIIGLLLGGILKGQELINSAKVKKFASDFTAVTIIMNAYQDKFRAIPGDDARAVRHLKSQANALGASGFPNSCPNDDYCGNGDGFISGNYNSQTISDESVKFWLHARLSGLATGPVDYVGQANAILEAELPLNVDGGRYGVQSSKLIQGMTGSYFVCSGSILGRYAKQLDISLDDGETNTGYMRIANMVGNSQTGQIPAVESSAIADDSRYVVCLSN